MKPIVIGTRGSELALWQARFVANTLQNQGYATKIEIIQTQGDNITELSFDKLEGKGFFTKEIEQALLDKKIDLAVHSCKDVQTCGHPDLQLAAFTDRKDAGEVLIIRREILDLSQKYLLPQGAKIGTSSLRRKNQLLGIRPDLEIVPVRGNINTRLEKLMNKQYDALVLAQAGVTRLGWETNDAFEIYPLPLHEIVPAPAQGALALQIHKENEKLFEILQMFNNSQLLSCIEVEREILSSLDGGCSLPLGVYCYKEQLFFKLWISFYKNNAFPKRFFLQDKDPKALAPKAIALLKIEEIPLIPSIFITKNREELLYLPQLCKQYNFELEAQSLIQTSAVPFANLQEADWIFFNSKNAVRYFLDKKPQLPSPIRFGVMGEGTEQTLHQYGFRANFVGQFSDSKKVALAFRALIEKETKVPIVLFPQSSISLRTIQEELAFVAKTIDLIVYRTQIGAQEYQIPDVNYYIFTSPSNVTSFFLQNAVIDQKRQKMIAIGQTTYDALKDKGMIHAILAPHSSEFGIWNALLTDIFQHQGNTVPIS